MWIKKFIKRFIAYERCAHKLALSCCLGIYIAFSPFFGFHTAMVFFLSWLFALNCAVMMGVSMLVNNPWTMMPVYGAGYAFGDWLLKLFGVDHTYNPAWVTSCNLWLNTHIGLPGISFWAFLIGGNIVGICLALVGYPFIKRYAHLMHQKSKQKVKRTFKAARRAMAKAKPVLQKIKDSKTPMAILSNKLANRVSQISK